MANWKDEDIKHGKVGGKRRKGGGEGCQVVSLNGCKLRGWTTFNNRQMLISFPSDIDLMNYEG